MICIIILFLSFGFGIITVISNLAAEIVTVVGQRIAACLKKNKSIISETAPKNVVIVSSGGREIVQTNNSSTFNRTPLNMETIRLDSSFSDMEYFSLDGIGLDDFTDLNNFHNEYNTLNFSKGVKCHSTPSIKKNKVNSTFSSFIHMKEPKYTV